MSQDYVRFITSPVPATGEPSPAPAAAEPSPAASRLDYLLLFNMHLHPVRKLRLTRHIQKQRFTSTLCKELMAKKQRGKSRGRTLVGWGDCGNAGAGIIRKARGPAKRIEAALGRLCTVVSIDEFRTSKMCAECGQVLKPMRGKEHQQGVEGTLKDLWEVRLCSNKACNAHVHRDINAARNMLAILICWARHSLRPPHVKRPRRGRVDVVLPGMADVPLDGFESD